MPGESRVVVSKPTACVECGKLLMGAGPHPERNRVSGIARIEPEIIGYQRHTLICCVCGAQNRAAWPVEMPRVLGRFDSRL